MLIKVLRAYQMEERKVEIVKDERGVYKKVYNGKKDIER